jgi:hypothetical protein
VLHSDGGSEANGAAAADRRRTKSRGSSSQWRRAVPRRNGVARFLVAMAQTILGDTEV